MPANFRPSMDPVIALHVLVKLFRMKKEKRNANPALVINQNQTPTTTNVSNQIGKIQVIVKQTNTWTTEIKTKWNTSANSVHPEARVLVE